MPTFNISGVATEQMSEPTAVCVLTAAISGAATEQMSDAGKLNLVAVISSAAPEQTSDAGKLNLVAVVAGGAKEQTLARPPDLAGTPLDVQPSGAASGGFSV